MNVAMAFCEHDYQLAVQWFERAGKFNQRKHDLFILPARECEHEIPSIGGQWKSVTILKDYLNVKTNWNSTDAVRDAGGANSIFRQFAQHFDLNNLGSWLFLEPDAILLFEDAIDRIETEYQKCGKPYLNAIVPVVENQFPYFSGIGVYPQNAAEEITLMLPMRTKEGIEHPWNLAGAQAVIPRSHRTVLIQHSFDKSPISSRSDFEARVSKEAVIYHPDKTGSAYQYLDSPASAPEKSGDGSSFSPSLKPGSPETYGVVLNVSTGKFRAETVEEAKHAAMLERMKKVRAARGKKMKGKKHEKTKN